jgi:uncharacterized membrane protein YbaN (DUF454 family)
MTVRHLWLSLGVASLACGASGIVLPLVPTTPFLLLAAYAFARSSPRLHDWLLNHPRFGRMIGDWRRHGSIARRVKGTAVAVMGLTLAASWSIGFAPWVIAGQAVALGAVAAFIVTRPDTPADPGA